MGQSKGRETPDKCRYCDSKHTALLKKQTRQIVEGNYKTKHYVECMECHACGPESLTSISAIESWNGVK